MRFGELTWQEVQTIAAGGAIAAIPTGCTEQQGPHLPVDNDTWFAEALLLEAADRLGADIPVVVLPALPFGPTPEHRGYGEGTWTFQCRSSKSSWPPSLPLWPTRGFTGSWFGAAVEDTT